MIKKLYIALALLGSLLLSACDSYLDIQPTGQVIPNTLVEYRALLTTAYNFRFNDRAYAEMRTDEVVINSDPLNKSSYSDIERWNDASPNASTTTLGWSDYYTAIFYANAIIDKSKEITEGSQEDINQLVGEAYLLRAYTHFLLVNLYGQPYTKDGALETKAVPLRLDVDLENIPSRTTVKEIYDAIVSDIEIARNLINKEVWEAKYSYRFSTISVDAMNSRVHLYMGKWEEAYNAAERVLTLKSTLEDFNKSDSKLPNQYTSVEMLTAYEFLFTKSIKDASLATTTFLQKYTENDLRLEKFFNAPDANGNCTIKKGGNSEFTCTFRTGELYLNSAEAAARLNKLTEARKRLLQLMKKRYTPEGYAQKEIAINTMGQANLISEIMDERARELAFEGHLWFDLRRTTRPKITKKLDGNLYILDQDDPRYTLRIPKNAIEANPGLLN